MRTVTVARLKNELRKYLAYAKSGEEVVIRERGLPVAKLVPFNADAADAQEVKLVAAGRMSLPKTTLDIKKLVRIRAGRVKGNSAIRALLQDREESM